MFEKFREIFPKLSEKKWEEYLSYYKKLEIPAKSVLLKEGDISQKAYFIEKGCLRLWFNNHGKDVTFQFFFENEFVSSVESFRKNIPSYFTLESIEPSIVHYIHKKDLEYIFREINKFTEVRDYMLNAAYDRQLYYMKQYLSFIRDTPSERYRNLIKEKPHVIRRVPQHYIASYLGITSVSLSRIRNKTK